MLSSHSWWKWSLPTITRTSGSARVSVSRNASILATHSSANGGRSAPVDGARAVVERVVRRGDDRDDGGHGVLLRCVGQASGRRGVDVDGVAVDGEVDVHADRAAALLGDLAEQPGRAGQQREAAQQLDGQAEVGQRGAADAGAVERQPAAEHLLVHAADRLEQPQVRPAQALLLGDADQHRRARVLHLVHRVAEARARTAAPRGCGARPSSATRVPAGVVGGQVAVVPLEHVVQVGRRSPR